MPKNENSNQRTSGSVPASASNERGVFEDEGFKRKAGAKWEVHITIRIE